MINYLGFQILKQGISPDPNLLKKIEQVATLSNKKELESFLGLANFYSRYLTKYLELIGPFNDLKKKNSEFKWTLKQERSFNKLKKALMENPIMKIFDPKKEMTLTTDVSECTISAILSQEDHPENYLSRKLTKVEVNYSNIEKDMLSGAQKELVFIRLKIFVKIWPSTFGVYF